MNILEAIILGTVQGLTEFLPVSSSGHLVIFSNLLNVDFNGSNYIAFFAMLHLGTLFAVVTFYRTRLIEIIKNPFSQIEFLTKILIVSLPAMIFGLIYSLFIEDKLDSKALLNLTSISLTFTGLFFIVSELISKKYKDTKTIIKANKFIILLVGIFQAIAILPGVSRSGSTIAGGKLLKIKKEEILDFTFIMSIPLIFIAGSASLFESRNELLSTDVFLPSIIGIIVSGLVGYMSISFLLKFLRKYSLIFFGIYCIVVGLSIILFK